MEARGVYREMLTQAWLRGASLPNDHEAIRRAIGATEKEWRRSWPLVERFWRVDGDTLVNPTQLEIYAEAQGVALRASERGRRGAQATAQARARVGAQALAHAVFEQCTPNSELQEERCTSADDQLVAEKEKHTKPADVHQERFGRFWSAYPRKVGKDAAWREWQKRSPSEALTAEILGALAVQSVTPQWLRDGGQFVPHPRTWLHQGRWQDEPERQNGRPTKPGLTGPIAPDKAALYDAGVIR